MREGLLYAIQLEPSGRTEELTLPSLAYDLKQPRILHARIRQVELLGESQLLSWSQDDQGLHLQLPACSQKQPRVLRLSFSFLEAFYKEWFRFLLYTVLIQ